MVEAVNDGFREGERLARESGHGIRVTALLTAMRHAAKSREIAELAVALPRRRAWRGSTSPGAEAGYPPTRHLDAFEYLAARTPTSPSTPARRSGCRASGRRSSGAGPTGSATASGSSTTSPSRDCRSPSGSTRRPRGADDVADVDLELGLLGLLAAYVRDTRIPLEMCPSSNLQTGAATSIAEHPISLLARLRFRVTLNTDNRLMSGTSMSRELDCAAEAIGYAWLTCAGSPSTR